MDDGSKPQPGALARALGEPLDLSIAPADALARPDPESGRPHVFTQADVDAAGAAAREARRAAMGPFERRLWERLAEQHRVKGTR